MAIDRQRQNVSYGLSQALIGVPAAPVISNRAPTTADKAELGTIWVNKTTDISYILSKVSAGTSTWYAVTTEGAAVTAVSFTATTGDITATAGNIVATAGNITASVGDITATLGNIVAGVDSFATRSVIVGGDDGAGTAASTTFTNVVDTTLSTGAGVVLMKTANPGDSSGWMKIYVGTDVRYIPYWSNISP